MALLIIGTYIADLDIDGRSTVLMAEDLINRASELEVALPHLILSRAYWDISFEYLYSEDQVPALNLNVVLSRLKQWFSIQMPTSIEVDYFIIEFQILPMRSSDLRALSEIVPLVNRDEKIELSIPELLSFEYFASKNGLSIANRELKDRFLSNTQFDVRSLKNCLSIRPYPYQAVGIEWLAAQQDLGRPGAILGDVMGLGKTLQVIGLLARNVEQGRRNNLVICPGTLISNWQRELAKFAPELEVVCHIGRFRAGSARRVEGHDVVITSYDVMVLDYSVLSSINWNVVALDEAQSIKNPRAKRSIRAKSLSRSFGVAISGTPLENKLLDLWSISGFADNSIFGGERDFESRYSGADRDALEVNELITPILLRRRLSDIEHQLPEKIVIDHPLDWPTELIDIYENVRIEALAEFARAGGLVATGRLRKLATHPKLMGIGPSNLRELSPKYVLTMEILEELFTNNEKALIFSSYLEMIDGFRAELQLAHPDAFIESLDGRVPMGERTNLVDAFNTFKGPGVLICNPIVAGAGLNITGANHVIHYNLEWNPAKEDQATFRVYRNGQTRTTFVHRLFYINTIDEVIDQRIAMKRNLADHGVDAGIPEFDYLAALNISPKATNGL